MMAFCLGPGHARAISYLISISYRSHACLICRRSPVEICGSMRNLIDSTSYRSGSGIDFAEKAGASTVKRLIRNLKTEFFQITISF
jgi:hypothetical protein